MAEAATQVGSERDGVGGQLFGPPMAPERQTGDRKGPGPDSATEELQRQAMVST